ncbi:hypothetical protein IC582_022903 [Cucumis melo]
MWQPMLKIHPITFTYWNKKKEKKKSKEAPKGQKEKGKGNKKTPKED